MSLTRPPAHKAPALTRDGHFHIFGPYDQFPLCAGRTYDPPPALVPEYLAMAEALGIQRTVVVRASVSGTENAGTLDAVRQFGQHRARAVAVIDDTFTDAMSRQMRDGGVRGARFNLASGSGTPIGQLEPIARRLAPPGWHIQVYTKGETLAEMAPTLARPRGTGHDVCTGEGRPAGRCGARDDRSVRLFSGPFRRRRGR
jgi:predicted TIM-barrel fold metal-dependent hydrolase